MQNGVLEDVQLLLDGARYGDEEDVTLALQQGVSVNARDTAGRTALHMACANGHVEIIRILLDAGADPDLQNTDGNTPLHWACVNVKTEAVKLLLSKGANPTALNNAGKSALDEAIARDSEEILSLFEAHSMPQNTTDSTLLGEGSAEGAVASELQDLSIAENDDEGDDNEEAEDQEP